MADTNATDKAQAPAGASAGTTAAGAAPGSDDLQTRLTALQAERDQLKQSYDSMNSKFHQRDREISELRKAVAQSRTNADDYGLDNGAGQAAGGDDVTQIRSRQDLIEFKLDHPDWQQKWPAMLEIAGDPNFATHFAAAPNSRATLEAAYAKATERTLAAKVHELESAQAKLNEAREQQKGQAFVTGQTTSTPHETFTRDQLEKMSKEELEKKFGKKALLQGVF